jgi:hypothetical protein
MKFNPDNPFVIAKSQQPEIEMVPITEREAWITVVELSHASQGIPALKQHLLNVWARTSAALMTMM